MNSSQYPVISNVDINCFKDHITSSSNNAIEDDRLDSEDIRFDMLFDPLMEPLIQSSLAHFLYIKKNAIPFQKSENGDILPDLITFHPNYIRFRFMDHLISNKASVTLGSFIFYEFSPSTVIIDRKKLMNKVVELVHNPRLDALVFYFVKKLQADGDKSDRILGFAQTKPRQ